MTADCESFENSLGEGSGAHVEVPLPLRSSGEPAKSVALLEIEWNIPNESLHGLRLTSAGR